MVNLTSVLNPVTAGKVWQLVEAVTFTCAGAFFLKRVKVTNYVATSTLGFLGGKSAYFIAQGLSHMAGLSTKTGRSIGWTVGITTATVIQCKIALGKEKNNLNFLNWLSCATIESVLGFASRELSLRVIVWICSKSLAKV